MVTVPPVVGSESTAAWMAAVLSCTPLPRAPLVRTSTVAVWPMTGLGMLVHQSAANEGAATAERASAARASINGFLTWRFAVTDARAAAARLWFVKKTFICREVSGRLAQKTSSREAHAKNARSSHA